MKKTISIILSSIWLIVTIALMIPLSILSLLVLFSKEKNIYGHTLLFLFAGIFSVGFNFVGFLYALFSEESTSKYLIDSAEADDVAAATKARGLINAIFTKKGLDRTNNIKVGDRITWFIQGLADRNELSSFGHFLARVINVVDFNHIIFKEKK